MGTKLAELAGMDLHGKVCVTSTKGVTTHYEDEAAAWKACKGMNLEYRRGAFFAVTTAKSKAPVAPAAAPAPSASGDESSSRRSRRRRSSED